MADERRKKLIQLIHVGKARLGWDEEAYRAFLWGLTGKESAAHLAIRELERALQAMRRLGFAVRPGRVKHEEKGRATREQLEYIKGMWAVCARNKSEGALAAFVKRITHVDALRFLTVYTAREVILALRDMMEKAGFDPDTSERVKG
jgi:hypothetical protein